MNPGVTGQASLRERIEKFEVLLDQRPLKAGTMAEGDRLS